MIMNQATHFKPLFHPGKLLVTPAALAALRVNGVPAISFLLRHVCGDWGTVSHPDKEQNDLSLAAGLRLLSIYHLSNGTRIIVITEWDRSSTAIEKLDEGVTSSEERSAPPLSRRYPAWPVAHYAQGA